MKISAIVIAHNEEKLLPRCLETIFSQERPFDEVIVVNNGSTDNTRKVAETFPVKIVEEPNLGILYARRAGSLVSTGDVICHLDADCEVPKGWGRKIEKYFKEDPKLICVSGPQVFPGSPWYISFGRYLFYITAIFLRVLRLPVVQGGNYAISRKAYLDVGGHDPQVTGFYGEDTHIGRKLWGKGKVKFVISLQMHSSPRRLLQGNFLIEGFRYSANYVYTLLFGKPLTYKWRNYR